MFSVIDSIIQYCEDARTVCDNQPVLSMLHRISGADEEHPISEYVYLMGRNVDQTISLLESINDMTPFTKSDYRETLLSVKKSFGFSVMNQASNGVVEKFLGDDVHANLHRLDDTLKSRGYVVNLDHEEIIDFVEKCGDLMESIENSKLRHDLKKELLRGLTKINCCLYWARFLGPDEALYSIKEFSGVAAFAKKESVDSDRLFKDVFEYVGEVVSFLAKAVSTGEKLIDVFQNITKMIDGR